MNNQSIPPSGEVSRRQFLRTTSLAAGAAALAFPSVLSAQGAPKQLRGVVLGHGGRGAGAGQNFLEAAKIAGVDARIVAVADVFPDRASAGRRNFELPESKCYSGFDGYIKALEEPGVNYAILASPPGFRPAQFKASIDRGMHVFMEKPVCVDVPGAKIMWEVGALADRKNLKVAAGTQRRHGADYIETIKRIHDGAIGEVTALRAYWVNGGPIWHRGERGASPLEIQVHNWYHYIWLSGDHIAEQHIHNLDVANWVMNEHPVKAWGMGARQMLGDRSGEIWDNFAVEYEYPNGVRCASYCGQIRRSWSSVSEAVVGSRGTANPSGSINPRGGQAWRWQGKKLPDMVQEHVNLIQAIVKDTPLNETKNVTDSSFTAILGREAAFSGAGLDWSALLNSNFKYGPDIIYTDDAHKLQFGDFRTLRPPLPGTHNLLSDPPSVVVA